MKKVANLLFIVSLVFLTACNSSPNDIFDDEPCSNEPPGLAIIIVKNNVERRDLFPNDEREYKKEAVLHKLSENKMVKIQNLDVYNGNIFVVPEDLETFYTGKLDTFYVTHQQKTDTLQIRGNYYKTKKCGKSSALAELYFNGKKINRDQVTIDTHTYRIDVTQK